MRKKNLYEKNGVTLVYFEYTEPITNTYVNSKMPSLQKRTNMPAHKYTRKNGKTTLWWMKFYVTDWTGTKSRYTNGALRHREKRMKRISGHRNSMSSFPAPYRNPP